MAYFQDLIPGNHCFGCGPDNSYGLKIKSRWLDDKRSECLFMPEAHHCSGPLAYVNGGILSTLLDCHCICTAIAEGYRLENREIGSGEPIWYVTGSMQIAFLKPTPISKTLHAIAEVGDMNGRKLDVSAEIYADGELVAKGKVLAVRVEADW